ncbi:MAG: SgcJ/EcaC family oxidoreductase [Thermomicrobiales bacterium]
MQDDEQAIRAVVDEWMRASRAGDVDTVLGLMTDDVVFSVVGREPFGKDVFAAASRGMDGMTVAGSSEIVELRVLGDWAFIRNHIRMTIIPADGDPVRRSGYTLTLLVKGADQRWRIARDANMVTTDA